MKSINQMVLVSVMLFVTIELIYLPISYNNVFAAAPDPCFGKHSAGCKNMNCDNDPGNLQAVCCWNDIRDGAYVCQVCQVNTDTGDFENFSDVLSKGHPGSGTVAPPPSGNAPPPSTEKCPDNTTVDKNGNCTPLTKSPEDSSDNNDNKPFRSNLNHDIMKGLIATQDTNSSSE